MEMLRKSGLMRAGLAAILCAAVGGGAFLGGRALSPKKSSEAAQAPVADATPPGPDVTPIPETTPDTSHGESGGIVGNSGKAMEWRLGRRSWRGNRIADTPDLELDEGAVVLVVDGVTTIVHGSGIPLADLVAFTEGLYR